MGRRDCSPADRGEIQRLGLTDAEYDNAHRWLREELAAMGTLAQFPRGCTKLGSQVSRATVGSDAGRWEIEKVAPRAVDDRFALEVLGSRVDKRDLCPD